MIKNDRVYGVPLTQYKDTKANIEALSGIPEGAIAYATDSNEFGSYDGTTWTWGQSGSSAPATTAANDFQVGNGSGAWVKKTLAETITILRTSLDSVYAALSHTHAASDITSGTLGAARLPVPTTTTLGGVARNTGSAGEYVTGIDASGNLEYDTPAGGSGGFPAGYKYKLTLSNNTTDATNDIDIATGICRDNTDAEDIVLSSAITKRLDASWSVGTNQGGLDTGSIANTTYHVWIIKRSDTGIVDVLFSTSATAPTMPTSYDYKRRIGSIVRISNAIKAFVQDGNHFSWSSPVGDVNATNPGTSAVTRTLTLPTGIRVRADISVAGTGLNAAGNPQGVLISDLSTNDTTPSNILCTIFVYSSVDVRLATVTTVYTNTSAQIRSRIQISTANTVLYISTYGWTDFFE